MTQAQGQQNAVDATQLDPNMQAGHIDENGIRWYSPKEAPFRLSGFPWFQQDGIYRRLPKQPSHDIRRAVDSLANSTAGGQVAFRTNTKRVLVKVDLSGPANMYHMPATGQCGFDCYVSDAGSLQHAGTVNYPVSQASYESALCTLRTNEMRDVVLNFPLYQGVANVWVGLDAEADVQPPTPYSSDKKVIVYGTSITQGGCASRPGMAYTNIMSRSIPLEFVNLGFSGNGQGEPEVAHLISQIDNPALIALDYEANCKGLPSHMEETLPPFIRILREKHPTVPILVVSKIRYAKEKFDPAFLEMRLAFKAVEQRVVEEFRAAGDENIHFFDGETLLRDPHYHECTVDGVHPNDLGFWMMAHGLTPTFRELLRDEL